MSLLPLRLTTSTLWVMGTALFALSIIFLFSIHIAEAATKTVTVNVEVLPNPLEEADSEYISFTNLSGDTDVDLSSYILKDGGSFSRTLVLIPANSTFTLCADEMLSEAAYSVDCQAEYASAKFNDGGDSVIIEDEASVVVLNEAYTDAIDDEIFSYNFEIDVEVPDDPADEGGDDESPKKGLCHFDDEREAHKLVKVTEEELLLHVKHEMDVIPPRGEFEGQNWDEEGQKLFDDDCVKDTGDDEEDEMEGIQCPLEPKEERIIVNFTPDGTTDIDDYLLRSDKGPFSALLKPTKVEIEKGTYKVTLVSFDDHDTKKESQPEESYMVGLLGKFLGKYIPITKTNPISDLPDDENYRTEVVNESLEIVKNVSAAQAVHAVPPVSESPNSIVPICAAFDLLGEDGGDGDGDGGDEDGEGDNGGGDNGGENNEDEQPTGEIVDPDEGEVVSGNYTLRATYDDGDTEDSDALEWAVYEGMCDSLGEAVFGNIEGLTDAYDWDGALFAADIDTSTVTDGNYCLLFDPEDELDENDVRLMRNFSIDNEDNDGGDSGSEGGDENNEESDDSGGGGSSSTGSGGGGGRSRNAASGEVLGATLMGGCTEPYLRDFLHRSAPNDEIEVRKLQLALNYLINANLTVTGIFDDTTLEAVKRFQLIHSEDVLLPWVHAGHTEGIGEFQPTGYVYVTTRSKINELMCPTTEVAIPPLIVDTDVTNNLVGA